MYAIGKSGTILHYNGASWSQMQSGTTHLLNDIWGTDENDIYITGGTDATGDGILLKLNNGEWEIMYDGPYIPGVPISGYSTTIWGMNPFKYYRHTAITSISYGNNNNFKRFISGVPNDNVQLRKIRGFDLNNIFAIGYFSLIMHYNGQTWQRYDQFYRKPYGDSLFGIWCFESDVFIGGMSEVGTAIIYHGKE